MFREATSCPRAKPEGNEDECDGDVDGVIFMVGIYNKSE